ncbi:MAG: mechanosensitive ion channel [Gammaproteobacteria bacterium]|nr:mechanosensitive ion channel [Gammaproteobacteria bacterium]
MDSLQETLLIWLDPQLTGALVLGWGLRLLAALLIYVIGRWVAKALTRWVGRAIIKADVDATLARFLSSIIYMVLIVFVVLTALSAIGINTTNFLAILGAAGLAVGLALKDSLSNFAAGVMLVFFRPFRSGDYIEAAGISGSVVSIKIFNTILRTPDNRIVTVPNALIYADSITNFSAEDKRRIDLVIGIGYDDDIARAKALIQGVLGQDNRILDEPAPVMLLVELGESSVDIAVRPWVKSSDYSQVRSDLLEHIKRALENAGLSIPYPQRDLHIVTQANADA